jgi:hypothetical protein
MRSLERQQRAAPRNATRRPAATATVLMALLSLALLGAECQESPETPPDTNNLLWVISPPETMALGAQVQLPISVYTQDESIQAWEIGFSVDPAMLEIVAVSGHNHFDDGTLPVEPVYDVPGGRVSRIVDFLHSPASGIGERRIAIVTVKAVAPGDSPLRIELEGMADSAGQPIYARSLLTDVTVVP